MCSETRLVDHGQRGQFTVARSKGPRPFTTAYFLDLAVDQGKNVVALGMRILQDAVDPVKGNTDCFTGGSLIPGPLSRDGVETIVKSTSHRRKTSAGIGMWRRVENAVKVKRVRDRTVILAPGSGLGLQTHANTQAWSKEQGNESAVRYTLVGSQS